MVDISAAELVQTQTIDAGSSLADASLECDVRLREFIYENLHEFRERFTANVIAQQIHCIASA